ncbi:MAG: hypothetical protein P8Y36_00430 [Alphaproteobacteria bacterium]
MPLANLLAPLSTADQVMRATKQARLAPLDTMLGDKPVQDRLSTGFAPAGPALDGEVLSPETPAPAPYDAQDILPRVPSYVDRENDVMRKMGLALTQHGSPAQRAQGVQMMLRANRPSKEAARHSEMQRLLDVVDSSDATEDAKSRARTIVGLGGTAKDAMAALGYDARGQKAARELQQHLAKAQVQFAQDTIALDVLQRDKQRVMEYMKEPLTEGLAGWAAAKIPNTPAERLNAHLTTFKSHIWADSLKRMREASETGGAVGQVTEREGYWLQSMHGSLDPYQRHDMLVDTMDGIIEGRKLFSRLRLATAKLEMGDTSAAKEVEDITKKLSTLTQDIVERSEITKIDDIEVPTTDEGAEFEKKYGGAR